MYDNYEPFEELKVFEFKFSSSTYRIWKDGKVVKEINKNITLHFSPKSNTENSIKLQLSPSISEMNEILDFDIFMTSTDRLQYYIIPQNSNANHPAIEMYKSFLGATRENMFFDEKTPFCCNLFLIKGVLQKISFSFSNPLILIEFE